MAGLDFHFEALEQCRTAVREVAEKFGAPAVAQAPVETVPARAFGTLSGASGLAGAINGIDTTLSAELGRISGLLDDVGDSLTTVKNNIRRVNTAGERDGERLLEA
ncbi:hypothetical protein [Microtetraspora niveoalba]|uniref:hypothetical protein n=1 Tax=Microtetraspora niveoalba TaxID=46175 RepID=UPI00082E1B9D|nr:hypothetical protein [Microtetraspora niveoalba]